MFKSHAVRFAQQAPQTRLLRGTGRHSLADLPRFSEMAEHYPSAESAELGVACIARAITGFGADGLVFDDSLPLPVQVAVVVRDRSARQAERYLYACVDADNIGRLWRHLPRLAALLAANGLVFNPDALIRDIHAGWVIGEPPGSQTVRERWVRQCHNIPTP